jgi:hypothetical protein
MAAEDIFEGFVLFSVNGGREACPVGQIDRPGRLLFS